MFFELVATIVAGFAAAGMMMVVNHATGKRLPKWLTPVAAGVAMIGVTISNEYGWYDRTVGQLPEGVQVIETVEKQSFYRPWTYVKPFTERFVALDATTLRTHPDQPGLHMADSYYFGRWAPVNRIGVLVDCDGMRRAAITGAVEFTDQGEVTGVQWLQARGDDALINAVCGGK